MFKHFLFIFFFFSKGSKPVNQRKESFHLVEKLGEKRINGQIDSQLLLISSSHCGILMKLFVGTEDIIAGHVPYYFLNHNVSKSNIFSSNPLSIKPYQNMNFKIKLFLSIIFHSINLDCTRL